MEQEKKENAGLVVLKSKVEALKSEISKVIVGQERMLDLLIVAILSNGHVLLEGVPGIAKTLTVKLLAKSLSSGFSRIQFTPDLMPSDVTGTSIFNVSNSKFEFAKGPIFSNPILIDEINRAPAKTQSALFEVMEERQVTVDGFTHHMQDPFLVFATQNPLEHEGTYQLPEAQLDRFLFKIALSYPSHDEEFMILKNEHNRKENNELKHINEIIGSEEIMKFQREILKVKVEDKLLKYITDIVHKTREHHGIFLGASPRASINALIASKAIAGINGRDFVIPEDIKETMEPILVHRLYLTPEKEMEGVLPEDIIQQIINSVEIPR